MTAKKKPTKASAKKPSKARVKKAGDAFYADKPTNRARLKECPDLVIKEAIKYGHLVAIEYAVDRDGKKKVYRHEFTRHRELLVDIDGRAFVIEPPCKITKRGIMG